MRKPIHPPVLFQFIKQKNDVQGKIIRIFSPEKQKEVCRFCEGVDKNKSILGLIVIKGMQCQQGVCNNGTITDPRNGKVYKATLTLADDGKALKVRGYVGIPLFGKNRDMESLLIIRCNSLA